ncbi:MAG: LamG-like jellyroll fold domain-containing protein, partial [Planctomycetota bacterium]
MKTHVNSGMVIVSVLALLALFGSARSVEGMVSHWKFDEVSGTIAYDSAGNNDGTVYGATWTTGLIDGALSFDGLDDYVDVGDVTFLDGASEATFSLWVKLDSLTLNQIFIHKLGDIGNRSFQVLIDDVTSGEFDGDIFDGTKRYFIRSTNAALKTGEWYHLVFVWNGGDIGNLYKNGIQLTFSEATTTTPVTISDSSVPLAIGIQANDLSSNPFNGKMDDVRIYNRALPPGEIWQLYGGEPSGPVSHWKFDEGEGDIAYDSAGTNHGTIYGEALWTTGQIDGALEFDGINDYVDVGDPIDESLDFGASDSFSISAWIKTNTDSPIVYKRRCGGPGGVYYEGYNFQLRLEQLYFAMEDTSGSATAISGETVVADDQWHHVVAVRDTATDELYLYLDGSSDATPVTDPTTATLATSRSLHIGHRDTTVSPGYFYCEGTMDDVRIYDRALSPQEIQELYRGEIGNKAFGPSPADEATNVNPNVVLSWSPGKDALSHDVYLGTEPNDVNEATPDSNEYMGNYAVNSYDPCGLDFNTTYCWRVDEVNDSNTYKGDVWSFTTWADPDSCLISKWMFDQGEGTIAYDSAGTNHGLIQGATWTTGQIDGALSFDGVDDYVNFGDPIEESLDFGASDSFSISAWVKPIGGISIVNKIRIPNATFEEGYFIRIRNNQTQFYIEDTGGADPTITGNTTLEDDNWYHVAAVRDTTEDKLYVYVDGSSDATPVTDTTTTTLATTQDFWIGRMPYYNYYFNGKIDDVRIYNRALSEEEILEVYRSGLCEPGYPCIKVWPETLEFSAEQAGPDPAPQTFSVSNFGDGILNYLITQDCSWLEVDPNTGSSTGEPNEATVSVDISGLTSGIHDCNVIVYDPNASNNPQIVHVQLEIILIDCNGNLIPDPVDIAEGTSKDCNGNGIPDECDIAEGRSTDVNDDGIPDECQTDASVVPVAVLIDPARTSEVRTTLPNSVPGVVRGNTYYIEIWASDIGETNTGLTSVYVDVAFCDETSASVVEHGETFVTFPDGTIQLDGVDEFGGSALPSGGGIEPEWVRVGWIQMTADLEVDTCTISLLPSSQGVGALERGLIPWTFVELGSVDLQITPPLRSYDLDSDDFIGVGDLGLFAGSWQQHVPPADEAHDFDCDNRVGVGDLSWFATGWQKNIDDPTILYPPCIPDAESISMLNNDVLGMPNSNTFQTSFPTDIPESPSDIAFGLAVLDSPSSSDTTTILPTSVKRISAGQTYYLELWVSDIGHINTGLTSAYVDLSFPDHAVSVVDISHSDIFTMFTSGSDFPGNIDELGGSTVDANGIEPDWARVAIVQMHTDATLPFVTFTLSPSNTEVAALGRGIIPWNDISLDSLMI